MNAEIRLKAEKRAEKTVELLKIRHLRLATAESCTGGLLSELITSVSGASEVFDFGAVTYSNGMKEKLLGVPSEILAEFGAVSCRTAERMSRGVAEYSGADIGIGITGIAGPTSDSTDKPVGLVFVSIAGANGYIKTVALENDFREDVRNRNRYAAVFAAFDLICEYLDLE